MTIKQSYYLFFFLLFNITLVQAQSISGKILDEDNEAIPYATIQIGENNGTISNEEGYFTINAEGFSKNENVKISYLGFEAIKISLDQFSSKDYILKERVDTLTEVYLTNKNLGIREILQKVRENVATNYSDDTNSKIFYRSSSFNTPKKMEFEVLKASELNKKTIKTINSQFNDLRKFSENKTSSSYEDILLNYSRLDDSIKINVIKATKLINDTKDKSADKIQNDFITIISKQLDPDATYKVKTGLFKIEDSLKVGETFKKEKQKLPESKNLISTVKSLSKKHGINDDSYFSFIFNDNKNDYKLNGIAYLNDIPVYKISFKPKKKSEKFEGTFYVNTNDFAVVKVDYKLGGNRFGERLNLKALAGIKFIETKIEGSVFYKKGGDSFYKPQFINTIKQQYVYLSRPFKFIKNIVNDQDEKSIFKFKFKIENVVLSKEELFFIDNSTNTKALFNQFKTEENYKIDKIETYNPAVWENFKIISPVESIKNYHLE